MIKVETLGMNDIAKINPTLVSDKEVANHSFITVDDVLYLVDNTTVGDDSYKEGVVFPAGSKLNGYIVKAWEGQKLVVDGKHVVGGISSLEDGDTLIVKDGKLEAGSDESGICFVVSGKTTLTEPAIKVTVVVGSGDSASSDDDETPHVYTEEELNAMEVSEIKALASSLGYTISEEITDKSAVVAAFLAAQNA